MDISVSKLKKYASECSVLYVEDDEVIRIQTFDFLSRFFTDIVLAEDGQIGLEKYKEREFDIVITDINMPNMNGVEMIEAIKDINYEQIVLVISAYNDSEYLMKFINLNVARFIAKPFNNKQFLYILYKISEELSFEKEQQELQNQIVLISKRAQTIVDQVNIGIVIIKDNKIEMANKAFLDIGSFDSFDTLILEAPEIGVLFEECDRCINATSNCELIEQLKTLDEEDKKVRIIKNSKTIEYQVTLSEVEEDNSYILTFSDITAIHDSFYLDEHTNLPKRKFTLEKIDLLKRKTSKLDVILIRIKHFKSLEKLYGREYLINLERNFSDSMKSVRDRYMPDAFIGSFHINQFIVILTDEDYKNFYEELKNINLSSPDILHNKLEGIASTDLSISAKLEHLNTDDNINKIEVELTHLFELMK